MSLEEWTAVDRYFTDRLQPRDEVLDAALRASAAAGLPAIQVSPAQGRFLEILARAVGARRVLEIGTLGGYSTIWLARSLPDGGRLVSLELSPVHAGVARANLQLAGVAEKVEVIEGPALRTLPRLASDGRSPFDLSFIDADKPSLAEYFDWAVRLSRRGSVIVVDNVVRNGAVTDGANDDPSVRGVRRLVDALASDPRVVATAVPTVGSKGYDGFLIAWVRGTVGSKKS
jgi:predicted O-methyltransferase YrrM